MGLLANKRVLITGLLSNRSIAYGIAKACRREGAEIALSYVGERFRDRSLEFGREFDTDMVYECDVGSDEHITRLFAQLGERALHLGGDLLPVDHQLAAEGRGERLARGDLATLLEPGELGRIGTYPPAAQAHHARYGAAKLEEAGSASDFVTRTIKKVLDEETTRMENGLAVLATVGATAPFVGLFGTVWGIMSSFQSIAASNHPSDAPPSVQVVASMSGVAQQASLARHPGQGQVVQGPTA